MPVEQPTLQVRPDIARKVWVLNRHDKEYVEEFRGRMLHVPPNQEKKLLLPYLEAVKFKSAAKAVYDPLPDGSYRPGQGPKALYIQELTDDERLEIEGITPEGKTLAQKRAEEVAALTCPQCQFVAADNRGLGTHITTQHVKKKEDGS